MSTTSGSGENGAHAGARVEELLHACFERPEPEWPQAIEDLCASHPDDAEWIRERFDWLKQVGFIGPSVAEVHFPEVLGDFRLQRRLGAGGMGIVYLAEQISLGRRVALKLIRPEHLETPHARERFEREARAASRLEHEGICPVYEVGEAAGQPFLAMRYLEGETLAQRIAGQKTDGERAAARDSGTTKAVHGVVRLIEKVARTLHVAHEAGLVHRDIKPSNIMITEEEHPVLLDFGLAHLEGGGTLTASGALLGTPAYMSPEQLSGDRGTVDRLTDVWSLGVTLFESLTGQRPFAGPGGREELYRQILNAEIPSARRIDPAIPRDLEVIIETALERDPLRRYPLALDLAEDLRRFRSHEPIRARRAGPILRTRRWIQRNSLVASVLVLLGVGLILSLVLLDAVAAGKARAEASFTEYRRMADVRWLQDLEQMAEGELWPSVPENVSAMAGWRGEAEQLVARKPLHERRIADLRGRALPYDDEMQKRDRARHPAAEELTRLERQRLPLEREIERRRGKRSRAAGRQARRFRQRLEELEEKIRGLESEIARERSWAFADHEDQWEHDVLVTLVKGIEVLAQPEKGRIDRVRAREAFAAAVRRRTIDEHREAWGRAIASITNRTECPAYDGLRISPQLGLIPIGRNPETKLWEFLHLETNGPELHLPEHRSDGTLELGEDTGLVFVLVPGGKFWMGAQNRDENARNYDPQATEKEGPVTRVALGPFFMSKYEMTQGQWLRMTGRKPSWYAASGPGSELVHPVVLVTWEECADVMRKLDFALPSEVQWEYAARAGTSTPWWTGPDKRSLRGAANLRGGDADPRPFGMPAEEWLEDGFTGTAPVGTFRGNAFGLHEVHGNVDEWCRGERRAPSQKHVYRGGSFFWLAYEARVAFSFVEDSLARSGHVGLRPALALKPDRGDS